MCGIVGLITKQKHGFNYKEKKIFYELLQSDVLRGWDATGVITCHNNGDFGIMKEAIEAQYFNQQFVDSDLDKDLFKNGSAVIGHNRAKTVGENKDENAHPFVVDDTFAMVHNGTLRNHKAMHDTVVDSEALAITFKRAMDKDDYVQAVSEAVWEIQGAFACVWFDQKRNQVGMIRNSQRPLSILETPDSVLFGSEVGLLNWIASRNDQKTVSYKGLSPDVLYLFDLTKGGGAMEEFPLAQRPVKTCTGPVVTKTTMGTTNSNNFSDTVARIFADKDGAVPAKASKNAFKRYKKMLLGRHLVFHLDDWVEKYFPDTSRPEIILLGSCPSGSYDLCEVKHTIKGVININDMAMSVKEVDFQSEWLGTVDTMEFDAKSGWITVNVIGIKAVVEDITVH